MNTDDARGPVRPDPTHKLTGGPAFPYSALCPGGPQMYADAQGMTLRDWFAGQALSGALSHPQTLAEIKRQADLRGIPVARAGAILVFEWADAMISERNRIYDAQTTGQG